MKIAWIVMSKQGKITVLNEKIIEKCNIVFKITYFTYIIVSNYF